MGDHDDIPGSLELTIFTAQPLSQPPLDAISDHCPPNLPAHSQSNPSLVGSTWKIQEEEIRLPELAPSPLDSLEVSGASEAHLRPPEMWLCAQCRLVPMVGTRRLRPLARRRARTFRPPAVLIRARNPWLRFLLMLLG